MCTKNPNIRKLSEITPVEAPSGEDYAVVMVGSFAPVHSGHFDAVDAAYTALQSQERRVGSLVLVPNSAEYLASKFDGKDFGWTYEKRIEKITQQSNRLPIPAYVDNISGVTARHEQINAHVPRTLHHHLGLSACQLFFVVGSDQLPSMETHLKSSDSRAICVLRPGNLEGVESYLAQDWAQEATRQTRLIVTERADMINDISSTAIRLQSSRATVA